MLCYAQPFTEPESVSPCSQLEIPFTSSHTISVVPKIFHARDRIHPVLPSRLDSSTHVMPSKCVKTLLTGSSIADSHIRLFNDFLKSVTSQILHIAFS
jgi:hypothetical protein